MKKSMIVIAIAAMLVSALLIATSIQPSEAAPMPAPTPISAPPGDASPSYRTFFDAQTATADATSTCWEISAYEKADIYYNVDIDAANINTTTVLLQHGNSPTALVDGIAVASAVAADAAAMNQFQLFGGYVCLKLDTTDASTGTITVTANALLK